MDRLECAPYLFDIITNLAKDPNIELYLLLNNPTLSENGMRVTKMIWSVGIFHFINAAFFMFIGSIERRIITSMATHSDDSEQFLEKQLDTDIFAETIILAPVLQKTKCSKMNILISYDDVDIKKIHLLGLDLMMRGNGGGIYQGKILSASTRGIISFHHGDNHWNRGGPTGFWEVYLKKPSTGFIIQILNESLDDGDVIFRGEVPTRKWYIQNLANILRVGSPFMEQIIKDYAATGTLPLPLPKTPYSNTPLEVPKFTETLTYITHQALLFLSLFLNGWILRREHRWSVAFVRSNWKISNLSKATVIQNPKGRFLADPFVATCDNQTVLFVEDYHYSTSRGAISAVRILPDGSYEFLPDIIREDFHLSFPYLFEYEGCLYMVPESSQAKAIRLYKCVQFPGRWEYLHDIMREVDAVDTMVFEHSGRWWLLTNMAPDGSSCQQSLMCVFSATSPLSGDWQPHLNNPVCFSPEFGRNGGLLRDVDGTIFRVRQKQGFNTYGSMLSIAKITRLDTEGYEEATYCEVEPKFFSGLTGIHHMYSNGEITVFDFAKEETI